MAGNPLSWHNVGDKEFEAGVSHVALFPMGSDGAYENGVAWNGVTAINENPSGADATDLYADDEQYATLRAAEKFGYSIEAYTYPDEFAPCDGSAEVDGVPGVYIGQQNRKAFGLAYITKIGDDTHPGLDKGKKLHLIYNSSASPSGRGYTTINENPDAINMSWDCNSTKVGFRKPAYSAKYSGVSTITIDSTKITSAKWDKIYNEIYGSSTKNATLPSPDDVLDILTATTTP